MKVIRFHIGTQKAGSTYLYNLLSGHPDVSLGNITEINYFSKNFEKGEDWYEGIFGGNGEPIDTSPKYFMLGETVAQRMKIYEDKMGEKLKMLLILRNPIDYLYSHFQMHLKHGFFKTHPDKFPKLTDDIIEFTKIYPEYLERAFYNKMFTNYWLKYFDIQQFKVMIFESFVSDTKGVIEEILDFWGLDRAELEARGVSKNRKLKYNTLFKLQKKISQNKKLKSKLKNSKTFNIIYEKFLTEETKQKLKSGERQYLKDIYKEDVRKLEKLLNINTIKWQDFK